MKGLRTLGIIPARAGSKRLPGKNRRALAGKPLVEWALEAALGAGTLDRQVVSSDDEEILEGVRRRDPQLALARPASLAADTSPAIDYVRHALHHLEEAGEDPYEAVVIVQPTSPLTRPEDIDATVRLLATTGADTAVTVVRLDHAIHPVKLKVLQGDRLLPYLEEERGRMAERELPLLYVRNCAVYATRRRVIEGGQILGPDCRAHRMPRERSVDINDELDFRFAEFLLAEAQG